MNNNTPFLTHTKLPALPWPQSQHSRPPCPEDLSKPLLTPRSLTREFQSLCQQVSFPEQTRAQPPAHHLWTRHRPHRAQRASADDWSEA